MAKSSRPGSLILILACALVFAFMNNSSALASSGINNYRVVNLGAKPDGKTDSTNAFLSAWDKACASVKPAVIHVPRGTFLLGNAAFRGPCNNNAMTFRISESSLVAPSDYRVLGNAGNWLLFQDVHGLNISSSNGILDGQGTGLWDCKASLGKDNCPTGAISLGFFNSSNIVVSGLTSRNSQSVHIIIKGCHNVNMLGIGVSASGNSPNTDGIHIQMSSDITIFNSNFATGDDCVSIGPGTSNLWIEHVTCGPGHGISVGSLGWEMHEPGVQNVTVKTAEFKNTMNGVRIKSWSRPSTGFVRHILFQHAEMVNVKNPIIIDQNYCPNDKDCPLQVSGIEITDVTYQDIHGTSATEVAVNFDCSSMHPCTGIRLEDVKLTYQNQPSEASCSHADGTSGGTVQPTSCL